MATTYMLGYRAATFIGASPYVNDLTNGFGICESNNYIIITTPIAGDDANAACVSIGRVALASTLDSNLSCLYKGALDAMSVCVVETAYLRPRGFLCDTLSDGELYTATASTSCSPTNPVICVNPA